MHLAIIDDHAHVAGVATRQRTVLHAVHDTLEDGGHEACVGGTTYHGVDEDELAAPLQVHFFAALDVHLELLAVDVERRRIGHALGVWLHNQVDLTKLSGTTRLLLVAIVGAREFRDGLTIRDARLLKLHGEFLVVLHTPLQRAQVEFSLSVNDRLAQFLALLHHPCRVLLAHLEQGCHHLLRIALVDGLDGA